MRITGGKARGIPLSTGRARQVRPATDRMREAVFSSLGDLPPGCRVLDLFAGCGSYGLEALSRGAGDCLFVERNPLAVNALEENMRAVLKSLGRTDAAAVKVIRRDVLRFACALRFDLIFMDPPYDLVRERGPELLAKAGSLLAPDGLLVHELPADWEPSLAGFQCRRRIGKSGTNEPNVLILER